MLSYARGNFDILRETNAKGETPLDIATAIGDTSLISRSRRAARGGRTVSSDGGVDIQRIMAVWERFFENAAACVGECDTTRARGVSSRNQHGQLATGHHETTATTLEVGGWVGVSDQPAMAPGDGVRASAATTFRSGDEDTGWSEGEADIPSLAADRRNHQLSRLLPGTPAVARARTCAWATASTSPVDDQEGKYFDGNAHEQPRPQQRTTDELHVRLESEALILTSDDIDLHLFQTPRGSSDAEVVWLSESPLGDTHSIPEPPTRNESLGVAAKAAGSPLHRHQTWVACWDATSESIYYWDSESGESTWKVPPDVFHEGQCCVWDPQREAFFTIDEGGTSIWLTGYSIEDRAAADDTISLGTTVPSIQVADYGKDDRGSAISMTRPSWQEFRSTTKVAEGSPSTEAVGFRDNLYATLAEEEEEEVGIGRALLQATTAPKLQHLRLSPYSLAEAGHQSVGQLPDDLNGFEHPGEQSSRGTPNFIPQEGAVREQNGEFINDETTTGEERLLPLNTAAAAATNSENAGQEDQSDGVEFFDARTCEDQYLSAWVMWCATPSHHNSDEPPFFVNEETCTSSWVLPPEAVATSGGWLRAWSEEHHAWFYANQWTGRVTWELQDIEDEGSVDSSARVES